MSYPLFEFLALTVGSISIVAAMVATLWSGTVVQETIAQGLLLVVLVGAVHRGKQGGLITALFAITVYGCMRVPMIMRQGFSPDVVELLLVRTLTYAVIGIGGGAVCARIHHFLARLESTPNIDVATQLFNERFITRTLRSMVGQYERSHKPFSVVILTLDSAVANPRPDQLPLLRSVADYLRENVRLIDDVGRLDDGRLLLVLPQTDRQGAGIAANRLGGGVKHLMGPGHDTMKVELRGAVEDLDGIRSLCGIQAAAIAPPAMEPAGGGEQAA